MGATVMISISLQSAQAQSPAPTDAVAALKQLATASRCAAYRWKERDVAPRSYTAGVALVFARAVCQPTRPDVTVVSAAPSGHADDALVVYRDRFAALGMRNDRPGVDTLRHSYALLIGLGMRESSGQYCEGRDVSQCFQQPDDAEAGLFQTSYGARRFDPTLDQLFQTYSADRSHCLLETFKGAVTCRIQKSHNKKCPDATSDVAGTGSGADWQRLTKSCPAFATEYGAVVLRRHGGMKGEFNPIRKGEAELRPECDGMLQTIQSYIAQHPEVCASL